MPTRRWHLPLSRPVLFLASYGIIQVFFYLGDSMMSYLSPLLVESSLGNPALMGLLIGSSSIFGLLTDTILGRYSHRRSFAFFLIGLLLMAPIFPLLMWFGQQAIVIYLVAMAVWGIYYEFLNFGNFRFIHLYLHRDQHILGWGVLDTFRALAVATGPIIAGILIETSFEAPLMTSFYFFVIALWLAIIFLKLTGYHLRRTAATSTTSSPLESEPERLRQIPTLWLLFKKIWPLWLCLLALVMIDATFWTIGPIFSQSLSQFHPLGGLLLTVYVLPAFFVGLLASPVGKKLGKKATAFVAMFSASVCLMSLQFLESPVHILAVVAIGSVCTGIASPNLVATFEDYVVRLKRYHGEMIALERSAVNIAYIIGPAIAGFSAGLVGYHSAFSVVGGFVMLVALVCLMIVPRKIQMPHQKLERLNS